MPVKVLRHFLYLDVELVGAFLEQLEGGKVRVTETTKESGKYVQGGLNIALMQLGGGGTGTTSHKETKTVYYDLYNRLEDTLRNTKRLVDLSTSLKKLNEVKENQFFLLHGKLTFSPVWSSWKSTGYVLSKINEWLAQLQASEQEQLPMSQDQGLVDATRSLITPNNRPVIFIAPPQRTQVLPTLPDEPPEQLRTMIKPEQVNISLDVTDKKLRLVGSGFLENFAKERITELSNGTKELHAHMMGLTTELSAGSIHFTPIAIFLVI
jgi:hypothetical protein